MTLVFFGETGLYVSRNGVLIEVIYDPPLVQVPPILVVIHR